MKQKRARQEDKEDLVVGDVGAYLGVGPGLGLCCVAGVSLINPPPVHKAPAWSSTQHNKVLPKWPATLIVYTAITLSLLM